MRRKTIITFGSSRRRFFVRKYATWILRLSARRNHTANFSQKAHLAKGKKTIRSRSKFASPLSRSDQSFTASHGPALAREQHGYFWCHCRYQLASDAS